MDQNNEQQNQNTSTRHRGIFLTILYVLSTPFRLLWRFIKWLFKDFSLLDLIEAVFD